MLTTDLKIDYEATFIEWIFVQKSYVEFTPFHKELLEVLTKNSAHVEKTLLETFVPKEFIELGLTRYYPRVYRGLPRVYLRDQVLRSHIKDDFTHLANLKKLMASRALFSLYSKFPTKGRVTIFTWVMSDGMGDFIAATEVMRLLKARLPDLDLRLISLVHEKAIKTIPFAENSIIIPYKEKVPLIPFDAFLLMAESDLILQLPTYYPYTEELTLALPHVRWETVGEYGFIESSWFHPNSDNHCLGLHFLEKGILTRRPCSAKWTDIQNEKIKAWHIPSNRFYLAYLATPIGGAIYLHSLLKSLENDSSDIDLCVPELGWFAVFYEKQRKMGRSILEWELGVSSIDLFFEERSFSIEIAPKGKRVRLLSPGLISQSDFRALLSLSEEWVAIRGNQSFSEAISQRKAFFYDGRGHARYFVKDFVAIAENRIGTFGKTLDCIRGMAQGFLYNVGVEEGQWVEENYFQELEEWTAIALKIGLALQDPEAILGFKKLDQVIAEEFSANSFLCHLVQRALCHHRYPQIKRLEIENMARFLKNKGSFKELIQRQKADIEFFQKEIF